MFTQTQINGGSNSSRNLRAFSFLSVLKMMILLALLGSSLPGHAQGSGTHQVTIELQQAAPSGSWVEIVPDDNWPTGAGVQASLGPNGRLLQVTVYGTDLLDDESPSTATIWVKQPGGTVHEGWTLRAGGTLVEINNIDL